MNNSNKQLPRQELGFGFEQTVATNKQVGLLKNTLHASMP